MKLLICLLSCVFCHAMDIQSVDTPPGQSKNMYQYMAEFYAQKSETPKHSNYPQLNLNDDYPAASAPYFSDDETTIGEPENVLEQTFAPAALPYLPPKKNDYEALLRESWALRQQNKTLEDRVASMEDLLAENSQMLRALLEATQQTGVSLEGVGKGQEQIESDIMSLTGKMRQWKVDVLKSQEHPLNKVLRYLRLGFNVSASTGTALSTYYTFAWVASILPAVLTPPGWILISTSAASGALYYVLYSL